MFKVKNLFINSLFPLLLCLVLFALPLNAISQESPQTQETEESIQLFNALQTLIVLILAESSVQSENIDIFAVITQLAEAYNNSLEERKPEEEVEEVEVVSPVRVVRSRGGGGGSSSRSRSSSPEPKAEEPAETGPSPAEDLFREETKEQPDIPSHKIQFVGNNGNKAVVTLKDSDGNILSVTEGEDEVEVNDISESKVYTLTAESQGYCSNPITLSDFDEETVVTFEEIQEDTYTYRWESDLKGREYECSSHVVEERKLEFSGKEVQSPHLSPVHTLNEKYNIVLSNEESDWSLNLASALLKVVSKIPDLGIQTTKFVLLDEEIENDIRVEGNVVYISKQAFNNTNPRMVTLDGKKGISFSHRAFHALVRFYTENGRDTESAERILDEMFAVQLSVPNIEDLTGEHEDNFQDFQPEEILDLISAFAESPEGQYKIPGLKYILRRKDGHPHPLYPGSPAVAWPRGADEDSYIEFMETAFYDPQGATKMSEASIHRLIIHEKAHFLWGNILSETIKNEWITTAGWYENEEDVHGWSNQYTTSFVSPYAHGKNPNEDFAETIAYYITNPNRLLNVSPEKYEFIKKFIMHGNEYILEIREDLKFEVLNLFPDYDYPGKIRGVYITAEGREDEDKEVTIELVLNNAEGYNDAAKFARTRLISSNGHIKDMYMYPVDGNGHYLKGRVTIPSNTKSGYWNVDQITIADQAGNKRMEGIVDFGFMLYINNVTEDTTAPKYVPNSLDISVEEVTVNGRTLHRVTVTWQIEEEGGMVPDSGIYANFVSLSKSEAYSLGEYGTVTDNTATVTFEISEYYPSGEWTVNYLRMTDRALNDGKQYFSNDPNHEKQQIVVIQTANQDDVLPTLDLNRISVDAVPFNEESPDGKTRVSIVYYAKDDKSGVGKSFYVLQDPNGNSIRGTNYHENFYTLFFQGGDPTEYKRYEVTHILPTGSVPGIWGLREMTIEDKGGNIAVFDFTEIIHFELLDDTSEEVVKEVQTEETVETPEEVVEEVQDEEVVAPETSEETEEEVSEESAAEEEIVTEETTEI